MICLKVAVCALSIPPSARATAATKSIFATARLAPLQAEFLPVYQQQLKDMIIHQVDREGPGRDQPLEGLKVVVNAGNGMGGFLAGTLQEVIVGAM